MDRRVVNRIGKTEAFRQKDDIEVLPECFFLCSKTVLLDLFCDKIQIQGIGKSLKTNKSKGAGNYENHEQAVKQYGLSPARVQLRKKNLQEESDALTVAGRRMEGLPALQMLQQHEVFI